MAKGNPIIGNQRGSIGDVTLSVYRGTQVSKKRNRSPRNPKTTPQMLQRMCMAQATKLGAFFASFIDHSWQGKQYGGVSRNYFVKRAVERIRMNALSAYDGDTIDLNFEPASFPYAVMSAVPFSEGSLQPLAYYDGAEEVNGGVVLNGEAAGGTAQAPTFSPSQLFDALGIPQDGQLTLISVKAVRTQSVVGGWTESGDTLMYVPAYSAIRIRKDPTYSGSTVLAVNTEYTAAELKAAGYLVETEGTATGAVVEILFDSEQEKLTIAYDWTFEDGFGQDAIAIVAVASLYEAKKWMRSSQDIKVIEKYPENFANALNSWLGSAVSLLNTDRLLNYEGLNP